MAQGIHGSGQDAEICGDPGYGAKGNLLVFEGFFKTGIKKG